MRIYVDTSVFGGCFDDGFEESSLRLMDMLRVGKYNTVISEVSERELRDAPGHVQQLLKEIPRKHLEIARLDDEAKALAELYLKKRIVTRNSKADTEHIAIATIAQVDLLVSWNFKHIVNYDRIRLYNAINLEHGYKLLEIRSPRDLTT